MANAKELIKNGKKTGIVSVSPEATVDGAIKEMARNNVGALVVKDPDGTVVGIVTERDILLKLNAKNLKATETNVSEIMTNKVYYVESTQLLEECMELMNSKGFRHLPVFEDGDLLGMISVKDVLREVIVEQKIMINHLEKYISGN